jgi:hypothetical protein
MKPPPLEPYYSDPLHDKLDAAENSVERWRDPLALGPPVNDAEMMGPLGRILGEAEASVEGMTVPPLRPFGEPEPPSIQPGPSAPTVFGSFIHEPPTPQESWERPWGEIEPSPATRPYLTHDGLTNRPYHPQFGGGTGIRNNAGSSEKWCARDQCTVDEAEDCPSCDEFGDHDGDGGVERCYFDWLEENQEQDGANEGDEE